MTDAATDVRATAADPPRYTNWIRGLLPRTISARISVLVLILLLVANFTQSVLAVFLWQPFLDRALQEERFEVAESLAQDLRPLLAAEDVEASKRHIDLITKISGAEVQVYLLNARGELVYPAGEPVPLAPVQRFLAPSPDLPIRNTDPGDRRTPVVFSAASVSIGTQPGYLYVPLRRGGSSVLGAKTYWEWALGSYLMSAAVAAVVVFLLGWRMVLLVTRPLRKLSHALAAFKAGDYRQRLDVYSRDEVAELAATFNDMAGTIEHTVAELTRVEAFRRELIAHISHDLRGPVASAMASLELLGKEGTTRDGAEQLRLLEASRRGVGRVQQLIVDLFELSKLELLAKPREMESVSLSDLASDLVSLAKSKADEKRVTLHVDLPEESLQVFGDGIMLERVVSNLIDNAVRYTPPGKSVTVRVAESEGLVTLSIIDEGPGIPQSEIELLGQPFYRVAETATRFEGTGLGLSIVKRILALHHTKLSITSAPGAGSTFSFSLAHCVQKKC